MARRPRLSLLNLFTRLLRKRVIRFSICKALAIKRSERASERKTNRWINPQTFLPAHRAEALRARVLVGVYPCVAALCQGGGFPGAALRCSPPETAKMWLQAVCWLTGRALSRNWVSSSSHGDFFKSLYWKIRNLEAKNNNKFLEYFEACTNVPSTTIFQML